MERDIALERYPDAEPVAGTLEVRNLPESYEEQHSAGGAEQARGSCRPYDPPVPPTPPQRFYSLDVLRGLAALGVVFWHWQHFYLSPAGELPESWNPAEQPLWRVLFLLYQAGGAGVDLFFVLSGFVFFWLYAERIAAAMTAREFAVLRFARLYPLHVATLLVVSALQALHVASAGRPFIYTFNDGLHFALNLLYAQFWGLQSGFSFNGPTWSVSIEVLLYAAFFVLARYARLSPVGLLLLVIVCFTYLHGQYDALQRGFGAFFVGGLTFHLYRAAIALPHQKAIETALRITMVLAWAGTLIAVRLSMSRLDALGAPMWLTNHFGATFLFPLTILCLAVAETRRGPIGKRLAFLGDASYSIYLLHFPLQIAFALLLPLSAFSSPVTLVAFCAVLIGLGVLSFRGFERPAQTWLRARLLRRPDRPRYGEEPPAVKRHGVKVS